jgi:hypothetical protein
MALHLSYPRKSHNLEDLRPLYEEFKRVEPDVFGTWQSIEKNWPEDGERKLVPISIKFETSCDHGLLPILKVP